MKKDSFIVLLVFIFSLSLFSQENGKKSNSSAIPQSIQLTLNSKVEIFKNSQVLWSKSEVQNFLLGRPIRLNIRSKNMLSVVHLTLYSKKINQWMVIAQAEVWYSNVETGKSNYFQTAKTFLINENQSLVFFPFGKIKKGNNKLENRETIRLTVNIDQNTTN